MSTPSAIVVGGGLAGMVIARELALRRRRVILLECSKRLGGKAGSDIKHGRLVEHGYHVFPQWYPNVRAIVDRIGVRLIDFDRYHYLVAVARVIAWLEEKLSPHQPDASGVRRRATPKLQMDARPPRKP
jgi:uncharacterized protein with NAD-binding domain and iron-sulfur cluster